MFFTAAAPQLRRPMHAPLSRSFERFLEDTRTIARQPVAQYSQDETSFGLELDLPGIAKEQLSISIEDAVVRIASKEGAPRQYRAAYEFAQPIDATASEARLENGVLTLKLVKKLPVRNTTEISIQ